jgi:hypothetical protein
MVRSAAEEIELWQECGKRDTLSPKMGYIDLSSGGLPSWAEGDLGSESCMISEFVPAVRNYEPPRGIEMGAFATADRDLRRSLPLANGDHQSKYHTMNDVLMTDETGRAGYIERLAFEKHTGIGNTGSGKTLPWKDGRVGDVFHSGTDVSFDNRWSFLMTTGRG